MVVYNFNKFQLCDDSILIARIKDNTLSFMIGIVIKLTAELIFSIEFSDDPGIIKLTCSNVVLDNFFEYYLLFKYRYSHQCIAVQYFSL